MRYLFLALLFAGSFRCFAQTDTIQPPFKRFPAPPPFQLLLSDSTTIFTKAQLQPKKELLLIVFSPECSHCQHETEELIAHKEDLKNVQIVMATMHPIWMMKDFIEKYKLNEYQNITVGKDIYYLLPPFYDMHNLPYIALYNKKGELITSAEGSMTIENVIDAFKAHE